MAADSIGRARSSGGTTSRAVDGQPLAGSAGAPAEVDARAQLNRDEWQSSPAAQAAAQVEPKGRVPLELAILESIAVRDEAAELPTTDEVRAIQAKGKDVVFGNVALREAYDLPDKSAEFARRERVEGVVLSIDSYDSMDLDNALSFRREADGSVVVGVHAVDLSAWIRTGSALDYAARRRTETRYLDDAGLVLPMLPLSLSEGRLSLFEGQPRLAKSVEMRFSPDGEFKDARIFRSALVNEHRIDTADAEAARQGRERGAAYPELADALQTMSQIAARASGAEDPGAHLRMDSMLQYFTRQATCIVGDALADAGVESSFRNQEKPNARSTYAPEARGHASLGARAYAQWTGPMRRYSDLDVHRAIDRYLDDRPIDGGRKQELDRAMREIQHERANKIRKDPRLNIISDVIEATRR